MRILLRLLKWLALTVAFLTIGAFGWLYFLPPELFRVANAYSAKMVCSNLFIAKRDPHQVLSKDVQAPGHPLLQYVSVEKVAEDQISAKLFGFLAREDAIYRPGLGCTNVPDHDLQKARAVRLPQILPEAAHSDFEWPLGDEVSLDPDLAVVALINDANLAGPGVRALVVVRDGRIVAESYTGEFNADTPLLGWSAMKVVTAALVSKRIADGKLGWDQNKLFSDWNDPRADISISNMLAMESGLDLDESYGDVNDVTRMLFLEPDQARFVTAKSLEAQPGTKFEYTTGTAVALTRVWMNTFSTVEEALTYPRKALFDPIGMRSAVMETDEAGTFSGGSLMYATARDWARFGLLLADNGEWNGEQLLPLEFMQKVATPTQLSKGTYTEAFAWKTTEKGNDSLPKDAYWAVGHDGQYIAIVPSEKLVLVRLGLTPSKLGYDPAPLLEKIIKSSSPASNESEPG